VIGGDKQAALPDPAEAGQVRRQFLGEDPRDQFVACPFRRRDRQGPVPFPLEGVCYLQRDLVQCLVHDIVAVVAVQSGSDRILPVLQHVDELVQKSDPHDNCTGKAGDPLTAMGTDEIRCTGKIGNAIVIRPACTGHLLHSPVKVHGYPIPCTSSCIVSLLAGSHCFLENPGSPGEKPAKKL
jgi:hypothetical protein